MNYEGVDELAGSLRAWLDMIANSQCLVVADPEHLPPQTRLLVRCGESFFAEFTILNSHSCRVLVKDGRNFRHFTEGTLLGTKKRANESTPGRFQLGAWKLLPGRLVRMGLLAYEVDGKEYLADGIQEVEIIYSSGLRYKPWSD